MGGTSASQRDVWANVYKATTSVTDAYMSGVKDGETKTLTTDNMRIELSKANKTAVQAEGYKAQDLIVPALHGLEFPPGCDDVSIQRFKYNFNPFSDTKAKDGEDVITTSVQSLGVRSCKVELKVQGLKNNPIKFSLPVPGHSRRLLQSGDQCENLECVYFDTETGAWSSDGVWASRDMYDPTVMHCEAEHLTDFAVLLKSVIDLALKCTNIQAFSREALTSLGEIEFWLRKDAIVLVLIVFALLWLIEWAWELDNSFSERTIPQFLLDTRDNNKKVLFQQKLKAMIAKKVPSVDQELNVRMAVANMRGAEEGFAPVMYSWLSPCQEDALMLARLLVKPGEPGLWKKLFIAVHPFFSLTLCKVDYPTWGRAICECTALVMTIAAKFLFLKEMNFTAGKLSTSEDCVQGGIMIQVVVLLVFGPVLQNLLMAALKCICDCRPSTFGSRPLHHACIVLLAIINLPLLLFIFCFAADGDENTADRIFTMLMAGVGIRYAVKPAVQMISISRSIKSLGPDMLVKWTEEFNEIGAPGPCEDATQDDEQILPEVNNQCPREGEQGSFELKSDIPDVANPRAESDGVTKQGQEKLKKGSKKAKEKMNKDMQSNLADKGETGKEEDEDKKGKKDNKENTEHIGKEKDEDKKGNKDNKENKEKKDTKTQKEKMEKTEKKEKKDNKEKKEKEKHKDKRETGKEEDEDKKGSK